MPENYHFPCGFIDPDGSEAWVCEISCVLVGCKACEHFNGTEYYERNIPKGVGIWARREINGGADNG